MFCVSDFRNTNKYILNITTVAMFFILCAAFIATEHKVLRTANIYFPAFYGGVCRNKH